MADSDIGRSRDGGNVVVVDPVAPVGPVSYLESESLPVPTAARLLEVHNHNGQLFKVQQHPGTPPSVTFGTSYAPLSDPSSLWGQPDGTYRFRGRTWTSSVTGALANDVVLLPDGAFRRRGLSSWLHLSAPDGWIGIFLDEELAIGAVTGLNNIAFYGTDLHLVTVFVAAVDPEYLWVPETDSAGVIDGRIVGIPVPAKEYRNRLLYNPGNRRVEICENNPHVSVDAQGDFAAIPDRNDLYVEENRDQVDAPLVGDFVFDAGRDHFYEWTVVFDSGALRNRWRQVPPTIALAASRTSNSNAVVLLGEYNSDDLARARIHTLAANTDYFYLQYDELRRLDLSTYVAPGTVEDNWEWQPVVPITEKAYMVFWGLGQSEQAGLLIDRSRTRLEYMRLRWHAMGPNQVLAGSNPGAKVLDAAPANADVMTDGAPDDEVIASNSFIQLPPGDWEVSVFFVSRQVTDTQFGGFMFRVMDGADDIILSRGSGYTSPDDDPFENVDNDLLGGHAVNFPAIVISVNTGETAELTVIIGGISSNANADSVHYAVVRRV